MFCWPACRYILVIKTKLIRYLSSVYFVSQPLHVSGIFVTHHQQVYCIYTKIGIFFCFLVDFLLAEESTEKNSTYRLLYIYIIPPDDGLQICPKHVEVDWRNKLRTNSASGWFLLHRLISLFVRNFLLLNN